jgi:DNA polymerase (family 10)
MDKNAIIDSLNEIAVLLELNGENMFKVQAYRNAARNLELLEEDFAALIAQDRLGQIKGIGEALREKITALATTGALPYLDELRRSVPPGLLEMLHIPGLGPKKVHALYHKLKISSVDALEAACRAGKISKLEGFGAKTEENILAGIERMRQFASQFHYDDALEIAESLLEDLRAHPDVARCAIAGSLRRSKETVKDIDLLASSKKPEKVIAAFTALPGVRSVNSSGSTKASVVLEGGIPCDLRVVSDKEFPYALHHFTGSKEHNVAMRQRAIAQNKKLSEWGLFAVTEKDRDKQDQDGKPLGKLIVCRDEEEIFKDLGLQFIPPELRENSGEIDAAEKNQIPRLVQWTDLKGTFHCHTTASDGKNTLLEMAGEAQGLGLEYLGIADHSKSSFQANGLSEERLLKQIQDIKKFNAASKDIHLFAGNEVDILKDGSLDYDEKILAQLDYVVASVHSILNMEEDVMTRRMIRAMENPFVTMLGHMTGRLLLQREGSALNHAKIIDCAAATGTWIEFNCNPYRLDMDWRWWRRARDKGVKCVINPDAHHVSQFGYLRTGANVARKGWLRKEDVVNTQSLAGIKKILQAKRG